MIRYLRDLGPFGAVVAFWLVVLVVLSIWGGPR